MDAVPALTNPLVQVGIALAAAVSIARLRRLHAAELAQCRVEGRLPPQLQGLVLANQEDLELAPRWLYQGAQLPFEDQMQTGVLETYYNRFIAACVNIRIRLLETLCRIVEPERSGPTLPFEEGPGLMERLKGVLCKPLRRRLKFRLHYRRHATWRIYNNFEVFFTFACSCASAALAVGLEAWEYLFVLCLLPASLALHLELPRYRQFRLARLFARWDYFLSCLYHEQKPEPFVIALVRSSVRLFPRGQSGATRLEGQVYLEIAATVGLLSLLMTPVDLVVEWLREPDLGRLVVDVSVRQLVSTTATVGLTYMLASAFGNSILRYRHQGETSGKGRIARYAMLGAALGVVFGVLYSGDIALEISQALIDVFRAAEGQGALQHSLLTVLLDMGGAS